MASTSYPSSLAQAENSLSRKQGIDFSDHLNTLFFQFIWWRITASQHIAPAKSINLRLPELVPPQFIESGRKNLMNPPRPGALGLEVYHAVAFRSSKSLERIHISAKCPIYRLSLPICRPTRKVAGDRFIVLWPDYSTQVVSTPDRRLTPSRCQSAFPVALPSRPAGRHRAPVVFTSGPGTLPGSSLPRLSMSRSIVPVCESAPQSSSASAAPE